MGTFNQDLNLTTRVAGIRVNKQGVIMMTVSISDGKREFASEEYFYSFGTKGWTNARGELKFAASPATDKALEFILASCQGDVDVATVEGVFDL